MAKFNLFKLISGDYKTLEKLKNPKLTHFLAEHVHPSLEVCFLINIFRIFYKQKNCTIYNLHYFY